MSIIRHYFILATSDIQWEPEDLRCSETLWERSDSSSFFLLLPRCQVHIHSCKTQEYIFVSVCAPFTRTIKKKTLESNMTFFTAREHSIVDRVPITCTHYWICESLVFSHQYSPFVMYSPVKSSNMHQYVISYFARAHKSYNYTAPLSDSCLFNFLLPRAS